jgi:crotonobetainyl-CoA:carnitine CoA-transferase CaiB-like acyl-CoA transferase
MAGEQQIDGSSWSRMPETGREAFVNGSAGSAANGALGHFRVLDLTSASGAYCGKLFADLGADVIKIEPPGGDPGRSEAPLCVGRSLPFLYENTNKRSVVLDLEVEADRDRFRTLAAEADLIIESFPVGTLERLGLDYTSLSGSLPSAHPGLVLTSISGFGQTGPLRESRSNDLIASALGGAMTSIGDPADPPVRLAGHQADVITATLAASSSLIALHHRNRTGQGQHIDVSSLEVVAAITHIAGVGKWLEDDIIPKRVGTGLVASVPSGAYRCKDGLVYLMVNRPAHWLALAQWINEVTGNEEVLMEEFHGPSSNRLPFRELLDIFIGDLTAELTVDEAYHEGQRRHIAFTPIHTAGRILADPQLAARGFFTEVELAEDRTIKVPGAPYRPARSGWQIALPAPELGEHEGEVLDRSRPDPSSRAQPPVAESSEARANPSPRSTSAGRAEFTPEKGALAGLRVVEFGTGLAAPWIGRMLAWAGAEVIKVESHAFPDVPRLFVPPREPELGTQPESSPWFTDWSAGKRFVSLDLRTEEGSELGRRIVAESDAVIANYSTGVLEKLGLGYERLASIKPDLVMLESSGFGESGPLSHYVTWGPNIEALSGLCSFSGFPDRECTMSHFAYPAPLSALHGLVALMAALLERDRSGQGQVIHLSQFETTVASIGRIIVEYAATGVEPERMGNREAGCAPYGCFPCRGEDRWVVLCVEQESDWVTLCEVMGSPDWAGDERFSTMDSRLEHIDELESRLGEWTAGQEDYAILEACRSAGLAAGVVQNTEDMLRRDSQLAARGFFEEIPHFKKGVVTASGIPLGLTGTPGRTTHTGSSIGHDNGYVFREILGLTQVEIDRFVDLGAIEDAN